MSVHNVEDETGREMFVRACAEYPELAAITLDAAWDLLGTLIGQQLVMDSALVWKLNAAFLCLYDSLEPNDPDGATS